MGDRPGGPLDLVHPDLKALLRELGLYPRGDVEERAVSEAIALAISLADEDRQLDIVSRLMSDQEIATQGLQHPDVLDTNLRIPLTAAERVEVLRQSPQLGDRPEVPGEEVGDCIICMEPGSLALPTCGCVFCPPCLRATIRNGLRSENNFPPRCCDAIPEAGVMAADRPGLVHLYRQLAAEVAAPALGRLYCHSGECATHIPPENRGECPGCGLRTCERCRGPAHGNGPCRGAGNGNAEEDDELEDVWATMQDNGAVNCPRCGRMVSLIDGCNHLTCACRAEFCYLCGRNWHTCSCPLHGSHHRALPIAQRPGMKPERWVARPARNEARSDESNIGFGTIQQLRPWPGERPVSWDVPRRRVLETGTRRPRTPDGRGPAARNEAGRGRDEVDVGRLVNEPRPPFPLRRPIEPAAEEQLRLEAEAERRVWLRGRNNRAVVQRALPQDPRPVQRYDDAAIARHGMPENVVHHVDRMAREEARARGPEMERLRQQRAQADRVMELYRQLGGGYRQPDGVGPDADEARRDAEFLNTVQLNRLLLRLRFEAAQPLDPPAQYVADDNDYAIEAFRRDVATRRGMPPRLGVRRIPELGERFVPRANEALPDADAVRRRQAPMGGVNGNVENAWAEEMALQRRRRPHVPDANNNREARNRPWSPLSDVDSSSSSSSSDEEYYARRRRLGNHALLRRFFYPFLDQRRR